MMESPKIHAAELLRSRQGANRKLLVFIGLALAMVLITTAVLVLDAQAMNYTRRVLVCAYELHEHTDEECGAPDARTCGLADYVVHVHNDDCYGEDHKLVCPLKEEKPHTHDASCLEEREELICEEDGITQEEADELTATYDPDHVHGEECYVPGEQTLSCGREEEGEHAHSEDCYAAGEPVLDCGKEETEGHKHSDACYAAGERVLGCGQEASEGHAHSDACYTPGEPVLSCSDTSEEHTHGEGCYTPGAPVLSCGQAEKPAHAHTDECYVEGAPVLTCGQKEQEAHAHTDDCYVEGEPELICGQDEHDAHAHTEDCYTEAEPVLTCDKGAEVLEALPEHIHTEECYETVTELVCGKLELHTHDDDCYQIIKPEDPEYQPYREAGFVDEEIRLLICEIPQLEEHVHGEDCFAEEELSPDEIAALKAQEMGIELQDLQVVYEDANVRVTVDYDTLSLVPTPAEVALVNANTPLPAPTPNPLLPVAVLEEEAEELLESEGEPAATEDAAAPVDAAPADAQPAAEPQPAAAPEAAPAPEAQPVAEPAPDAAPEANDAKPADATEPAANDAEPAGEPAADAPAAPVVANSSEAPELVRAGLMAEGREWLPASTVVYTVQYLDNGKLVGEPVQYAYTPGGEMPVFPRSIARYYRECRTDAFIVTARYTEFAQIPEEAELRAFMITDEEQIAAYESAYKEALNTSKAQMLSLLDIGFWLDDAEVQPAAPVEITVQLLGEDGLPAGEPLAVVHFGEQTEVLAATADDAGVAAFNMNGFSPVGIGQVPTSDEEGRVLLSGKTFEWIDPQGLYQVTFEVNGVISPVEEDAEPASEEDADAEVPSEEEPAADKAGEDAVEEPQEDKVPLATDSLLDFMVEIADESNALYETYAQEAEESSAPLMHLAVLEYRINYNGIEMDLSGCEVTITVTPTMLLQAEAAEFVENIEADNGDDDHDGYVESADGESRLPAPMVEQFALLSVSVPQQNEEVPVGEEAEGTEEAAPTKHMILLDGFDAVADAPLDVEMLAMVPAMDTLAFSAEEFGPVMTYASTQSVSLETVANGSYGVAVLSVEGDPKPNYQVQYYANITMPAETGTNALTLIDTSGGELPTNKGNTTALPTGKSKYLYVDNTGKIQTVTKLIEVYTSGSYNYFKKPSIPYVEKLIENPNYELKEIWVLKSGKKANSIEPNDWNRYTYDSNLYFTNIDYNNVVNKDINDAIDNGKTFIYINEGAVLRFVYDQTTKDNDFSAAFYDYDISTGRVHRALPPDNAPDQYVYKTAGQTFSGDSLTSEVLTWAADLSGWDGHLYAYTKEQGINSSGNYSGSGIKLAFGNVNTGTNLGRLTWPKDGQNNELNKYNNKGYAGCTFGLVTGMSDGKIQYAPGIQAPKLFNEGSATGKTEYADYPLQFARVGDTYTLTAVKGTVATDLSNFTNPTNSTGKHTDIWTNNFWPMDSAPSFGTGTHDVKFGGTATFKGKTHEIRFGPITQKDKDYTFPESDDGKYHNSYFGMHFEVKFNLVKDYVGPLEYWFFGDDDMWVFLDGKLVCDIGGVHSSVGEYVNLWDYITKGSEGEHTLSFFYTERGASGSTCWMQFTLPSVSSTTPETSTGEYGQLQIDKRLVKLLNGTPVENADNGERFQFTIDIKDANGNTDYNGYSCARYKTADLEAELKKPAGSRNLEGIALEANLLAFSSATFTLGADESIYIEYLPMGTKYTITESDQVIVGEVMQDSKYNYSTTTKVDNGEEVDSKEATGTITQGNKSTVVFTNTYKVFNLPKTGDVPTEIYFVGGGALMLAAAWIIRKRRKKAST